jgi:hypothetical protein
VVESVEGKRLVRGTVAVDLEDIGEGLSGDYDESDGDDKPLLRFTVCRVEGGELVEVPDGSYCTRVDARAEAAVRQAILEAIMEQVHAPAAAGLSVKDLCERLSWIDETGSGQLAAPGPVA